MELTTDLLVFGAVLALRLLVPLAIPKYPLPAIIAALVLDGIDQTIFQRYTDLDLTGYQSYDKALDIYYLTIAYISTLRNWDNLAGFETSRFLYYYRLAGVLVFELTQLRAMLLIFPNTFEYFFIFYEAVRLRWNPARMATTLVIGAAAVIWIAIKLPQEYWIHIAQRDVTDTLAENPVLIPILGAAVVLLLVATWWLVTRRLPPADRQLSFAVDEPDVNEQVLGAIREAESRQVFDRGLAEKVIMVSLVSAIFSQILPDMRASGVQVTIAVAILVVSNTVVSEWLQRRGVGWTSTVREFIATAAINAGLAWLYLWLLPIADGSARTGPLLFFLFLITLLVTLYDRYRPFYLARVAERVPSEQRARQFAA